MNPKYMKNSQNAIRKQANQFKKWAKDLNTSPKKTYKC